MVDYEFTLRIFFSNVNRFMTFPKALFRNYDIRGFLHEITPELAQFTTYTVVKELKVKKLVIGRDMRETSPALMEASIRGARLAGAEIVSIGLTNTSVFNYAVTTLEGVDLGIMITASHNPANYNGMKVVKQNGSSVSGVALYDMVEKNEALADDVLAHREEVNVEEVSMLDAYLEKCLKDAEGDFSDLRIVVDYGNGMGIASTAELLQRLGVQLIELYKEPDAHFPNHEANPADEETLHDIKKAIVQNKAHLGIALDGDVDRVRFIDEKGHAVTSDATLALLAEKLLLQRPGSGVVVTVNMGKAVREAIVRFGGNVLESAVGRTNVPEVAKTQGGILGGEVSGHFIFETFSFLESVDYTIVVILSLLKKSGKTLSELSEPLMNQYANSGEINREIEAKDEALRRLEEHFAPIAKEVNKLDGVKVIFSDWWCIARKSNTEPVVRVTVEAKNEEMLKEKVAQVLAALEGK